MANAINCDAMRLATCTAVWVSVEAALNSKKPLSGLSTTIVTCPHPFVAASAFIRFANAGDCA